MTGNGMVHLSLLDMQLAAHIAVQRRYYGRRMCRQTLWHQVVQRVIWDTEIEGAAAECAYAKAHGQVWEPGVNTFHLPDVGDIRVRSTTHADGCLIIRDRDPDGIYALVVGRDGEYQVIGRRTVVKAELPEAYRQAKGEGKPAWFIPQTDLEPDTDDLGGEP